MISGKDNFDICYNTIMENETMQFLLTNGYFIMFIMMIVEGPIVTMAAAFLASMGYFSLPAVLAVSVIGDLVGDLLWYFLGRKFGLQFVRGPGKYLGMNESMISTMHSFFLTHGGKAIFTVKSTTGLCLITFVAAGIARMNLKKFIFYSLLGGVLWSSTLVAIGYFFGYLYEEVALYISWAGWIVAGSALIIFVAMNAHKKNQAKNFLKKSNHL